MRLAERLTPTQRQQLRELLDRQATRLEERCEALRRPSGEDLPTTEADLRERIRHEDH